MNDLKVGNRNILCPSNMQTTRLRSFELVFLVFVTTSLLGGTAFSQNSLYLGLHAGLTAHFPNISTNNSQIKSELPLAPPAWNFGADIRLDRRATYLHLGIGTFRPMIRYQLGDEQDWDITAGLTRGVSVQAALKYKLHLWKNRLYAVPMAGVQIAHYQGNRDREYQFRDFFDQNTQVLSTIYTFPFNRNFSAFPMVGINLEYAFDFGLVVSVRAFYARGLSVVNEGNISYQIGGGPIRSAGFLSRYSHLPVQLGVSYAVSRLLWEKR
jgi:hypothetical protein